MFDTAQHSIAQHTVLALTRATRTPQFSKTAFIYITTILEGANFPQKQQLYCRDDSSRTQQTAYWPTPLLKGSFTQMQPCTCGCIKRQTVIRPRGNNSFNQQPPQHRRGSTRRETNLRWHLPSCRPPTGQRSPCQRFPANSNTVRQMEKRA